MTPIQAFKLTCILKSYITSLKTALYLAEKHFMLQISSKNMMSYFTKIQKVTSLSLEKNVFVQIFPKSDNS